jgi:BirA family biotin operon repressor/biotin-[acetyl-CoA-carboxylase] ligase
MAAPRWQIQKLDTTASTNDDVRRAAEAGEAEGLVIAATEQTAGRGRLGRIWESPPGNLYCSVLLRPANMPASAGFYSFVASLALFDVMEGQLPFADILLKWPNDVLVNGKKIGGILLETAGNALIIGVGVNIASHPENVLYPATSLAAEGKTKANPQSMLDNFLQFLGHWHLQMQTKGFPLIRAAWTNHTQQGVLNVRTPQETVQGTFAGLDNLGHLRLLLADGTEKAISTGDTMLPSKDA